MPAPEHAARGVEEAAGLGDGREVRLDEGARATVALEDVTLAPGVDRQRAAGEDGRPIEHADGDGHVVEADVVEHDCAFEHAVARSGGPEEDGRVGHDCVNDRLRAGVARVEVKSDLRGAQLETGHIEKAQVMYLAVVDSQALERPAPVPVHVDG